MNWERREGVGGIWVKTEKTELWESWLSVCKLIELYRQREREREREREYKES
jgi:hypothetical protein